MLRSVVGIGKSGCMFVCMHCTWSLGLQQARPDLPRPCTLAALPFQHGGVWIFWFGYGIFWFGFVDMGLDFFDMGLDFFGMGLDFFGTGLDFFGTGLDFGVKYIT